MIGSIYDIISELRPYFYSLREVNEKLSLDLKISTNWKVGEISKKYKNISIVEQDRKTDIVLISIVTETSASGYDLVIDCGKELIKYNIEREEKERLFKEKVKELEMMFKNNIKELETLFKTKSVDELKIINLRNDERGNNQEDKSELVREGNEERRDGNGESQTENDRKFEEVRQEQNVPSAN